MTFKFLSAFFRCFSPPHHFWLLIGSDIDRIRWCWVEWAARVLSQIWECLRWPITSIAGTRAQEILSKCPNAQSSRKWRPTETFFAESLGGVKIFHFTSSWKFPEILEKKCWVSFYLEWRVNNVKVGSMSQMRSNFIAISFPLFYKLNNNTKFHFDYRLDRTMCSENVKLN